MLCIHNWFLNRSAIFDVHYEIKTDSLSHKLLLIKDIFTSRIGSIHYKELVYISITDEKESKIYLFNNEGDMVNGFPLKGTNIVDIVDSDNDGKIELISQLDNNSVISYEIN